MKKEKYEKQTKDGLKEKFKNQKNNKRFKKNIGGNINSEFSVFAMESLIISTCKRLGLDGEFSKMIKSTVENVMRNKGVDPIKLNYSPIDDQ